jgi:hypothetical protein
MRWLASCAWLALLAASLVASAAVPASASPAGPTMFSDALSISAPASVNLGSITIGAASNVTASLGTVTVNGTSALLGSSWAVTVTSTGFTNGTTMIPPGSITYTAGAASASGLSLTVPGAGPLSMPVTAQSGTVAVGLGLPFSASWSPTIKVTVPASVTAGTYTATITHSAA